MKETLVLQTIDQIKAISHPYRMDILKSFSGMEEPMSVKMLADEMGETPSKIHYHLKELVKNDILELVKTREINGILEKFYYPVAENITIEKNLLSSKEHTDGAYNIFFDLLDSAKKNLNQIKKKEGSDDKVANSVRGYSTRIYLTEEQIEEFNNDLLKLIRKYESTKDDNKKPYEILHLFYPQPDKN